MCNRNQLLGAAGERLSAQMRDAVLGNDVIHVVFARGHDRTGREDALDLADRTALGSGRKSNEGDVVTKDSNSEQSSPGGPLAWILRTGLRGGSQCCYSNKYSDLS